MKTNKTRYGYVNRRFKELLEKMKKKIKEFADIGMQ